MGQSDIPTGQPVALGAKSHIDAHLRVALGLAKERDHQLLIYLIDMAIAENATGSAEPLAASQKPPKLDLFTG